MHHHLFQFKISASKTGMWLKEIISCTVKVSKVKLGAVRFERDQLEMLAIPKNRLLMVCSYNGVSGSHATFSHVCLLRQKVSY